MLPNGFKSNNWINREYKYAVKGNYPGVSYIETNVRRNSQCLVLKLGDWWAECLTLALTFNLTVYVTGSWSIADF